LLDLANIPILFDNVKKNRARLLPPAAFLFFSISFYHLPTPFFGMQKIASAWRKSMHLNPFFLPNWNALISP
tara:strand:- start:363 stop:578 length:216 start_codon:yes stop_codon:yes gene_type:complete